MRTTVALDDEMVRRAEELTGIHERAGLVRAAFEALIQRESARRLALLGGIAPDLEPAPRRRSD